MPDPVKPRRSSAAKPTDTPTTPPLLPSGDYSYTVELVMGMQKTLGELTQSVKSLTEEAQESRGKLDQVSHAVYGAKVALWVVGIITAAAGSTCGFILKMIFDAVIALNKK